MGWEQKIRTLIAKGKTVGSITYLELFNCLPEDFDSEQIEDIIQLFSDLDISLRETKEDSGLTLNDDKINMSDEIELDIDQIAQACEDLKMDPEDFIRFDKDYFYRRRGATYFLSSGTGVFVHHPDKEEIIKMHFAELKEIIHSNFQILIKELEWDLALVLNKLYNIKNNARTKEELQGLQELRQVTATKLLEIEDCNMSGKLMCLKFEPLLNLTIHIKNKLNANNTNHLNLLRDLIVHLQCLNSNRQLDTEEKLKDLYEFLFALDEDGKFLREEKIVNFRFVFNTVLSNLGKDFEYVRRASDHAKNIRFCTIESSAKNLRELLSLNSPEAINVFCSQAAQQDGTLLSKILNLQEKHDLDSNKYVYNSVTLLYAVKNCSPKIVSILLEYGADPKEALMLAAKENKLYEAMAACIQSYIKHNLNISKLIEYTGSAFEYLNYSGSVDGYKIPSVKFQFYYYDLNYVHRFLEQANIKLYNATIISLSSCDSYTFEILGYSDILSMYIISGNTVRKELAMHMMPVLKEAIQHLDEKSQEKLSLFFDTDTHIDADIKDFLKNEHNLLHTPPSLKY